MKRIVALASFALISSSIWAAVRTATLEVPGMTCPACPITVRKALERVPGVSHIAVDYPKREVVVTYHDEKTNEKALLKATANAGYPSQPVGKVK